MNHSNNISTIYVSVLDKAKGITTLSLSISCITNHGMEKEYEIFLRGLFLAVIYCTFDWFDVFCQRSVEQLRIQENQ